MVNEEFYAKFRESITQSFPDFLKILLYVENALDIHKIRSHLAAKEREIKYLGKPRSDLDSLMKTIILEVSIQKKNRLPTDKEIRRVSQHSLKFTAKEFSPLLLKTIKKNAMKTLEEQRLYQKDYERRLFKKWSKPLGLLELLVGICIECGQNKKQKFPTKYGHIRNPKHVALIKLHVRALLITNEVLTLLKSGYPDGASARWRSLHELSVIASFLARNADNISRRYLDHEIIRRFKEAMDYKVYHKRLHHPPLSKKNFNNLIRKYNGIISKYGTEFAADYGWIPKSILSDRKFRALEKNEHLDHLRPVYNISSDTIHGGPLGFYSSGLINSRTRKILLVGPSVYGLADPLQDAAISLNQVTTYLLTVDPDFTSLLQCRILGDLVEDIKVAALATHRHLRRSKRY